MLSKILKSNYTLAFLLLVFSYVFTNIFISEFSGIDYIVILFALFIPLINEDTAIIYSLIFGFFYDYISDSYIGTGILLFLFLSYLKIVSSFFFELSSIFSNLLLSLVVIAIYVIFNIFYFDYYLNFYVFSGILDILSNFAVYLIIFLIMEFRSAFSVAKR